MRFSQLLACFGFIKEVQVKDHSSDIVTHVIWADEFNTEPEYVLKRVMEAMEKLT